MDVFFTVTRINLANKALPLLAAFFSRLTAVNDVKGYQARNKN